ncbi:MarR family winged helix-turn-helix transcriptional regulator [Frondihabitans australicus]|uniref:MarR family transcriptional regulator n=1 Tax=Frondihabitans australicus TaxID=386892 RepID=A0A495IBD1_9MICO|nr:MarR family transcriptional regulator [Frondihabitans australicus]RKR73232.1 MarR family transcriptional regulator [Frondihabitans australicus]
MNPSADAQAAATQAAATQPTAALVATELRVVMSRLQRRLREVAAPNDLSPSQTSILSRLLKDGPASVSDLARAEGVRPQSLGATIAVLDGLGYVTGRPDPNDGRRTILTLTDDAHEQFLANRVAKTDWFTNRLTQTLDASEIACLAEASALLGRLLDTETAPATAVGEPKETP